MKMKNVFCWLGVTASFVCGDDGFENVIEMIELGAGDDAPILWNMPGFIAAEGRGVQVGEPIPEAGAIFVLSTTQLEPFQNFFLAETAVGAYLPTAEIEIVTHDTESLIPQTRADREFEVKVQVEGLFEEAEQLNLPPEAIQQAATRVNLELFAQDLPDGQDSLPGGLVTVPAHTVLSLEGNRALPSDGDGFGYWTHLSPEFPDKARGEEHFVVRSLFDGAEDGGSLASAVLRVWPVWTGGQSGLGSTDFAPYVFDGVIPEIIGTADAVIIPNDSVGGVNGEPVYEGSPPDVTFFWNDLYPSATINLVVTDADATHPWGGRIVSGIQKKFNEDASHDHSELLTQEDWGDAFSAGGRYAIWMVTHTPGIGWEVGGNLVNGELQEGGWIVTVRNTVVRFRGSIQSLR